MAQQAIADGSALRKLKEMVAAQGGDISCLEDPSRFPQTACHHVVKARQSGYITAMDTEAIGITSVVLGAGRASKEDAIDYAAGLRISKKTGEWVEEGQELAVLYTNRPEALAEAEERYQKAVTIGPDAPEALPLVQARVTAEGVERL